MYDSGKITFGIIIFIVIFTSPFWFNIAIGNPDYKPEPVFPQKENQKECVAAKDYMRLNHMSILNDWRYEVVRTVKVDFKSASGKVFDMSLTNTCLNCHNDTEQFCDKCHNYAGVSTYCFDCHVEPHKLEKAL